MTNRKLFLLFMVLLFGVRAGYAGEVIKSNRHFIYKPPFWSIFHKPTTYTITAQTANAQDKPITVTARVDEITLDEDNVIRKTGVSYEVKPSRITLAPKQVANIKLIFPIKKSGSILFLYSVSPDYRKKEGVVQIVAHQGWAGMVTFLDGKYNSEPVLTQVDNRIKLTNKGIYGLEGTLQFRQGEKDEISRMHYFLESNKSRWFEIPDLADRAINHTGLLDVRQGILLR